MNCLLQQVTGVEDIDESRRILDEHGWDLIGAINGYMGFEAPRPAPSFQNHNEPGPSLQSISYITTKNVADAQNRNDGSSGPIVQRQPSFPNSLFLWVWKLVRSPVDLFFRCFWKFIGVGLHFIRSDPRRGTWMMQVLSFLCIVCENTYT